MKRRILVVDDEDPILEVITRVLKGDYAVDTARDGVEALDKLQQSKYNILLTDIVMPNMDGLTLLKQARELDPFIQVIVMTGYASVEMTLECLENGANKYVLKPFDIMDVKKLIKLAVDRIDRWEEAVRQTIKK